MSLELLIGPMFAGKSSAILQRIRRQEVIGKKVYVITHSIDTRFSEEHAVKSHNRDSHPAVGVSHLHECASDPSFGAADYVIIEEAQFFDDLRDFVLWCVESEKKGVLVVGLDGDSSRRPFGQILELIPYCDRVEKLRALCKRCGDGTEAIFSALVRGEKKGQICVGAENMYEAMCRVHFLENSRA